MAKEQRSKLRNNRKKSTVYCWNFHYLYEWRKSREGYGILLTGFEFRYVSGSTNTKERHGDPKNEIGTRNPARNALWTHWSVRKGVRCVRNCATAASTAPTGASDEHSGSWGRRGVLLRSLGCKLSLNFSPSTVVKTLLLLESLAAHVCRE